MDQAQVLSSGVSAPELRIVETGGRARAVVWPGIGAQQRSMHVIQLDSGGRTTSLSHPSDAVYHVCEGSATVTETDNDSSFDVGVGAMLHIDAGTTYRIAAGAGGAVLLGGPCPPDPALYQHLED